MPTNDEIQKEADKFIESESDKCDDCGIRLCYIHWPMYRDFMLKKARAEGHKEGQKAERAKHTTEIKGVKIDMDKALVRLEHLVKVKKLGQENAKSIRQAERQRCIEILKGLKEHADKEIITGIAWLAVESWIAKRDILVEAIAKLSEKVD